MKTNKNPHNVSLDIIIWKKNCDHYEFPLKVNIGTADYPFETSDGRKCIKIAELHSPERCTYICHPDNFKKIDDFAKRIILGEITLSTHND
jgi:hypothetical protein